MPRSGGRTWDAPPRPVPGSIGGNRNRRAGSDHCRCTDSQGSMRMFAYRLCETPLVERTADCIRGSQCVRWWFPLRRPHMSARGPRAIPTRPGCSARFDTHRGPARGLAGVDGRAEGGWARPADTGGGWPYGADDGGPYGPGWMMGRRYQQTRGGGLAGQAIDTHAANAATGNSMPR